MVRSIFYLAIFNLLIPTALAGPQDQWVYVGGNTPSIKYDLPMLIFALAMIIILYLMLTRSRKKKIKRRRR